MIIEFRLVYRDKESSEIAERIKEVIENTPNTKKEIRQFIKIIEEIFSEDIVEVKEIEGKITKNEKISLLNIIRKNIVLEYEKYKDTFASTFGSTKIPQSRDGYKENIDACLAYFQDEVFLQPSYIIYNSAIDKTDTSSKKAFNYSSYVIKTPNLQKDTMDEKFLLYSLDRLDEKIYKRTYRHFIKSVFAHKDVLEASINQMPLYTLADLYEQQSPNNNNKMLIDYGIQLAYEKKDSIMELLASAKRVEKDSAQSMEELSNSYNITKEELEILLSIIKHREAIKREIDVYEPITELAEFIGVFSDVNILTHYSIYKNISRHLKHIRDESMRAAKELCREYIYINTQCSILEEPTNSFDIQKQRKKEIKKDLAYKKYQKQIEYNKCIGDYPEVYEQISSLDSHQISYITKKAKDSFLHGRRVRKGAGKVVQWKYIFPIFGVSVLCWIFGRPEIINLGTTYI